MREGQADSTPVSSGRIVRVTAARRAFYTLFFQTRATCRVDVVPGMASPRAPRGGLWGFGSGGAALFCVGCCFGSSNITTACGPL